MNPGYPPELRREVLARLRDGRPVREVAADLAISVQTIYTWRAEDERAAGPEAVMRSEHEELLEARRRLRELEVELDAARRATQLLQEVVRPKARFEAMHAMAAEGRPIRVCARAMGVSESGYYAWRARPASAHDLRHAQVTEIITEVHRGSRATFGVRRVHAELRHRRGLPVARSTVGLLMRRAGLRGAPGNPQWCGADHRGPTATVRSEGG